MLSGTPVNTVGFKLTYYLLDASRRRGLLLAQQNHECAETPWAVWTDLSRMNPKASETMASKLLAVFSHRSATRLKRLSLPKACSMRARPR